MKKKYEQNRKRDNRLPIKFTEDEKKALEEKAKKYNYKTTSSYVRDACLNENIIVEELSGINELAVLIGQYIKTTKQFEDNILPLCRSKGITPETDTLIKDTVAELKNFNIDIRKTVDEKLNVAFKLKKGIRKTNSVQQQLELFNDNNRKG